MTPQKTLVFAWSSCYGKSKKMDKSGDFEPNQVIEENERITTPQNVLCTYGIVFLLRREIYVLTTCG